MASGRILKTQISLSEQVNDLPLDAALLFTWMIPHADDFGRMCGSARKIKAQVVPMRDDFSASSVERCLLEMQAAQLIERYEVIGELYIQFPKWEEHQSGLHKRTKSKIPDPPASEDSGNFPEPNGNSRNFPEVPAEQNRTRRELEREQEIPREDAQAADAATPTPTKPLSKNSLTALLESHGITGQLAVDFIAHRKAKKAPVSETVMDGFQREAGKACISVAEAARISIERNWQGFRADWNWQDASKEKPLATSHSTPGASQQPRNDYGRKTNNQQRNDSANVLLRFAGLDASSSEAAPADVGELWGEVDAIDGEFRTVGCGAG